MCCSQDTSNVADFYSYVTSHTWGFVEGAQSYQQTDTLDGSTCDPLTSTVDHDDFGFGPFDWNQNLGYRYPNGPGGGIDSSTSTAGPDWDRTPTVDAIKAALDAVSWNDIWAGLTISNTFTFDRANIAPDEEFAPGSFPSGNTGDLIASRSPDNLGPTLDWTGSVGALSAQAISGARGISLDRTQIQIRGFTGSPIPYFIYEIAGAVASISISVGDSLPHSLALEGPTGAVFQFFRKVSEGFWTTDLQIIQLPDPDTSGPRSIAPAGFSSGVTPGSAIRMVVGKTFEDWMEENLGPTWADYVF